MARPCPACAATAGRPAGSAHGFALTACRRCATLFCTELPEASQRTDYDAYYDEGNLEIPAFVHDRLAEVVRAFGPHRQTNRWLDVGFGAGALLQAARAQGWEVTGTEVAAGALEALAARGFDVRAGDLEELDLPAGAYDVVSLVEVVEHVPDPVRLLGRVHGLLRPGGVVHLTTPHARGLSGRLLGARWSVVAPPEHLQLLSVAGARAALRHAGLRPRVVHTHAINPHELVEALRGRAGHTTGDDRVEAGYRLNEALNARRSGVLARRAVNAALSATRLGDALKVVAQRPG